MPTCIKCYKFMKSGYKQVKTRKFGINPKIKSYAGGITPPKTWYDKISYECKNGCCEEPKEPDYRDSEEYKN